MRWIDTSQLISKEEYIKLCEENSTFLANFDDEIEYAKKLPDSYMFKLGDKEKFNKLGYGAQVKILRG